MKFREGYELYLQNVNLRVPMCHEHKENLFDELTELIQTPDIDRRKLEYYRMYLESCGEIDRPGKPFICFSIYLNIYSVAFPQILRRGLAKRKEWNEKECRIFNIPPRYYGMTFDTIEDYPEQRQMIKAAKNWIKDGWKNSFLLGSKMPGIGKTNTMVCTGLQRFVEVDFTEIKRFQGNLEFMNSSIIFIKERELISILDAPGMYRGMILERLCHVDYLMYDDMLAFGNKEFSKTVLMELIDARVDSGGKPTVITTRVGNDILERHYPDIYSRLSRGKIYYSDSKRDLRKEK